jgi:hypothetical protein
MVRRRVLLGGAVAATAAVPLLTLQPRARAATVLPLRVVNHTFRYPNSDISLYIVGTDLSTGQQVYVRSDGSKVPVSPSLNGPDGFADLSIPLVANGDTTVNLPWMSGRVYISMGQKIRFKVVTDGNGRAALQHPAGWVSSDPSYQVLHDFMEFTFNDAGMFCNVTMVDMFSIPMSLTLQGQRSQTTGTLTTNGRDNIFAAISAIPEFKPLVVGSLRVIAPGHGIDAGLFSATYFDPYVNEVWSRYSSTDLRVQVASGTYTARVSGGRLVFNNGVRAFARPSTRDIFYCDGALNAGASGANDPSPPVAAVLGAAFNRSTVRDFPNQPTTDPNTFYTTPISNHYSRVIHQNTQDHKAYGFAFDDVVSLASYIEDHAPTSVTLRLTPFGPQDPGSGNTGGNQLQAGQRLPRDQRLTSANGRFTLVMQADGNLVLYDNGSGGQSAIWATNTWTLAQDRRPTHADMQTDGNLVLYNDAMQPAWGTGIFGPNFINPYLELQDDGNLVIYHDGRRPLWATNTARP